MVGVGLGTVVDTSVGSCVQYPAELVSRSAIVRRAAATAAVSAMVGGVGGR
jgi:hypothetical protein